MTDTNLKSPIEIFKEISPQHRDAAEDFFEKLLQQSGVDADANRNTVDEYNRESAAASTMHGNVSRKKLLRTLLIVGIVIACIAIVIGALLLKNGNLAAGLPCVIIGAVFTIVAIVVIVKKINPAIKTNSGIAAAHDQRAAELLAEARMQVAPLNALFTNKDTLNLISKVMPDYVFDDRFTAENERFMAGYYGFKNIYDCDTSVTNTLSGRFNGNPFVFTDTVNTYMGSHTYSGSLYITWTESVRDSQGHTKSVTRSQTLHASVTKPEPKYRRNKDLFYGNQAAPDLSFSRKQQHSERLSAKEREKTVRKGEKELEKLTNKSTSNGNRFQCMSNTEFEVLFGATDRDHEVQFRLMFTPMAQRNTTELLTTGTTGFGDDFKFVKVRCMNLVSSEHAQSWTMDTSPVYYYSHDVDEIKSKFINFNTDYFRSLFFDFAPLMCVPVYMENPTVSAQPLRGFGGFTEYEHEVMANAIGAQKFAHKLSATDIILKTELTERGGDYDVVRVTAFSYAAYNRVDYVRVPGGDGHSHNVPVEWIEYIPVSNSMYIRITENSDAQAFDGNCTYIHGMKGEIL